MASSRYEDIMQSVVSGLLARRNLDDLLENIIESAGKIVGAANGYIDLADEATGELHTKVTMGLFSRTPPASVKPGNGFSGRVWQSGEPLLVNEYDSWEGRLPSFPSGIIKSSMGIPLKADNKMIGLLVLATNAKSKKAFGRNEIDSLSSFAMLASLAIQNVQLYEAALRSAGRRTTLSDAVGEISTSLNIEDVYQAVHKSVEQNMPCEDFIIDLYNEELNMIVPAYIIEHPGTRLHPPPYYADHGLAGHIVHTGQSMRMGSPDEINKSGIQFVDYGKGTEVSSVLAVPMKLKGKNIGILSAQSYRTNAYAEGDQEILGMLAAHAAVAIENARLFQQMDELAKSERSAVTRRTILYDASQEISSSLNIEQVYQAIHHAAQRLMPCDDFIIDLYDENNNEVQPVYVFEHDHNLDALAFFAEDGEVGHILKTGKSIRLNSPEDMELSGIEFEQRGSKFDAASILAVPVRLKGQIIGIISTRSYQTQAYTNDDQELLEMLATHAAIAFENARQFAHSQKLASTDSLTSIYNRRRFFELADREFKRAERYDRPLAALMMDLDNFKVVNDNYGHPTGDQVLYEIAKICLYELRDVDLLGRYGGDEFIALLPETRIAQASSIADRLRVQIESAQILLPGKIIVGTTMSFGVAALDKSCTSLSALVERADQALYKSKQSGRNRVSIWPNQDHR